MKIMVDSEAKKLIKELKIKRVLLQTCFYSLIIILSPFLLFLTGMYILAEMWLSFKGGVHQDIENYRVLMYKLERNIE